MSKHLGRDEVARRKKKLQSVFDDIAGANLNGVLISHYSRYLCVLVSGHAEQSVKELAAQYVRKRSEARTQRYVGVQIKKLRNIDLDKLRQLVESFDPSWWENLRQKHPDELDAFDSIATTRNNISHGGDSGITLLVVKQYFDQISTVLDELCDLFDPK